MAGVVNKPGICHIKGIGICVAWFGSLDSKTFLETSLYGLVIRSNGFSEAASEAMVSQKRHHKQHV